MQEVQVTNDGARGTMNPNSPNWSEVKARHHTHTHVHTDADTDSDTHRFIHTQTHNRQTSTDAPMEQA